ncbi:hypothetical protein D3C80_1255730 [compost metagenome]
MSRHGWRKNPERSQPDSHLQDVHVGEMPYGTGLPYGSSGGNLGGRKGSIVEVTDVLPASLRSGAGKAEFLMLEFGAVIHGDMPLPSGKSAAHRSR